MIYFTISNDLHYLIDSKYAKEILTYGLSVTFIRYRDVRNFRIREDEGWETVWLDGFPRRFHLRRLIFTFYKNFHNFKQLVNISFCKKDVLFILTEYELNNLLLTKKARRAKATTVLLDEGLGTFIINNYRISDYEFTYKHYIRQSLFSLFSTALLNCVAFGCQPFFLYSLLPKIKIWEVLDSILRDLNYNFIFSLDQIKPTYESGLKADKLFRFDYTILDFLRDILKRKREL